ncbi:hypothetical protein [Pararhizobium sp. DWP1-1-3]|uniref:hypothetical protein n=1 Tax=Pararhizobium sp. DWP1-1-3 TaxID=2804652 RepID=UPI003CE71190
MGYFPDAVIEEMRGSHLLGIFLHVATDPPLHVWFGTEDVIAGIDSIDAVGTAYLGGGELIGIPTLEVLVNGAADRIEFTLSGLEPGTGAKLVDTIPPVRGADVFMGLTTLDRYYQPMSAIIPVWNGTAAYVGESSPPVMGMESPSLTLSLAVVTGETARSRPSRSIWSPTHQKAISPTDKFCDETARLARGVDPTWTLGY